MEPILHSLEQEQQENIATSDGITGSTTGATGYITVMINGVARKLLFV